MEGESTSGRIAPSLTSTRSLGPLTAEAVHAWENRIKHVQQSRATPEVRERVKASNERQQRAAKAVKSASRLERTNMLNMASSAMALQSYSAVPPAAPAPPAAAPSARGGIFGMFGGPVTAPPAPPSNDVFLMESASRYQKYSSKINTSISAKRSKRSEAPMEEDAGELESTKELDDLEDEMRRDMDHLMRAAPSAAPTARMMGAFGFGGMGHAEREHATVAMTSELMTLLNQLATEPTNDAEISAKFLLFENFLGTVVTIREETLTFWGTNKDQFSGQTRVSAEREIAGIDNSESMGIVDDPRKWFVYSMTKKASENSASISKILSGLRARLELLSQDLGECPYCLEQMSVETSTVLGCCHRACTECWDHWVALKGARAFCPLCRNEEFIQEVLS
jgi:hypothetical protein